MFRSSFVLALMIASGTGALAQGSLFDQGQSLLRQQMQPQQAGRSSGGSLSSSDADSGLREALKVATKRTVAQVGKPGGYLNDQAIHIPLPGFLETARKGLGAVGASGTLDDLETRMNRAAEAAAPKAYDIIASAVSKMSVSDAIGIVRGPNDAATQYLRKTTTPDLTAAFRPVVDRELANAGALKLYDQAKASVTGGGLGGGLGAVAGALGGGNNGGSSTDFTGFVVDKALAGLFHYIGNEEASIRTNPVARSTDLLKRVFGG